MGKIEWVPNNSQYCHGKIAKLGKWIVGEVFWDGTASRDSGLNHKAKCRLPGIKETLGNFESEARAIIVVESAINLWVEKATKEEGE